MTKKLLRPLPMLACGLAIGLIARLLDIYTQNLGNMFSGLTVWVLLGVMISVYSPTKIAAAMNILPFCLGMLATYYLAAELSHGVYGWTYILFWTGFALCTPVFAWFTWYAKEPGWAGKALSVGIIIVTAAAQCVLDKLRLHDVVVLLVLAGILFFVKVPRKHR